MNSRYLPRDPNYTGTLPPARPFAYSSNLANASSVPITATMVPVPLVKSDYPRPSNPTSKDDNANVNDDDDDATDSE